MHQHYILQGAAGEAVVMDDDEEEAADGPDPEPLAFPDALPIALVDESLPVSKPPLPLWHLNLTPAVELVVTLQVNVDLHVLFH